MIQRKRKEVCNMKETKEMREFLDSYRLLGEEKVSNNTRITGCNNIDLIIGSSGSGKSGGYVGPNILVSQESLLITDPKGILFRQYGKVLRERGFRVHEINMRDPSVGSGYDPLHYVRFDKRTGRYNEQDIVRIATMLSPDSTSKDPFWERTTQIVLECLISYTLEELDEPERNLASVADLFRMCRVQNRSIRFLEEYAVKHPDSYTANKYAFMKNGFEADKTWSCTQTFLATALDKYDFGSIRLMLPRKPDFRFEDLGRRKTAVFINTSDTDTSLDSITSLLYTQCIHALCQEADAQPDGRLRVPCRLMLDDFAASAAYIPEFDKLVSVLRSREISISCILQSLSQLSAAYGADRSSTILNNADHILFMGCSDIATVDYISKRVCTTPEKVMTLENDKAFYLARGERGRKIRKIKPYSMTAGLIYEQESRDHTAILPESA